MRGNIRPPLLLTLLFFHNKSDNDTKNIALQKVNFLLFSHEILIQSLFLNESMTSLELLCEVKLLMGIFTMQQQVKPLHLNWSLFYLQLAINFVFPMHSVLAHPAGSRL